MPFLGLLGGSIPWKALGIIGAIVAVVVGVFLVLAQAKRIGKLEGQVDQAVGVANDNAGVADGLRADIAHQQAVGAAATKQKTGIAHATTANIRTITDAPETDDGPMAAVLQRTYDRLYGHPDGGTPQTGGPTGRGPGIAGAVPSR